MGKSDAARRFDSRHPHTLKVNSETAAALRALADPCGSLISGLHEALRRVHGEAYRAWRAERDAGERGCLAWVVAYRPEKGPERPATAEEGSDPTEGTRKASAPAQGILRAESASAAIQRTQP